MREKVGDVRLPLGRSIKRLRRQRGFSQERLAELAEMSHKHLGEVERGKTSITIDKLTAIAAGLSVNIVELFPPPPGLHIVAFTERELEQIEQTLLILRKARRIVARRD